MGVKVKIGRNDKTQLECRAKVGQLIYCSIIGVNLLLLTMKDCAIINSCSFTRILGSNLVTVSNE